MERALAAERHPAWQRSCPEMSDIDFIRLGLLRCISAVDSGRHFIQTTEEVHNELLPHSTYFKSLKSSRRTSMLEAIEQQSYKIHCEHLASSGIDYLKSFPELDEYTVEAADGHFIDHACHTPKGANGKVYAAGFIYAMNLRNGLLRPLCCITNGTKRHHELPILRNYIDHQNSQSDPSEKKLYVYDKAVTDFHWWAKQKSHQNYMISVLKENSVATWIEPIGFDANNPINTGIEDYSIYENQGVRFNVLHYRDPETQKLHRFVSTLPKSINPGTIAILYYKRWTIEKAYNNSKSDLKEKKAWSSSVKSLNNQMRLTTMTYNLMRVCEEISKIQDPKLVHPSDKKYTKSLEKRQERAKNKGGFVNPLLFLERIARISSYTIRAVQNAIITGKPLADLMCALMARLVPG
ncbi:MAG: hypothetical protein A6F70_10410 [Cycloclasticus sp. symbiont of Bathymodiolus heckerae]|nr:MAG: hypothetical protein A6F70_10410 [Cycloclasticus sp. symbiont of Bathymodiolus heckerae]